MKLTPDARLQDTERMGKSGENRAESEQFPEGMRRRFDHADGRWFEVEVVDCRLRTSWGEGGKRGRTGSVTLDSRDAALRKAASKVRKWCKEGFEEGALTPGVRFDLDADVIATFRSAESPVKKGTPRFDFVPVAGRPHVFEHVAVNMVHEWLVCSPDLKRAIDLRTSLRKVVAPAALGERERAAMAEQLLDFLEERRDDILSDRDTPVRKLPLDAPVGRFTHVAVLSPTTYNHDYFTALGRSLWKAFPCHDCELTGDETVTIGEARCAGRGSVPYGNWARDPHPVFDLRYVRALASPDEDRFLVHAPKELEQRVSDRRLASMKEAALDVRNYRGEVRRLLKGQSLDASELQDLRSFLGFAG